MNIRVEIGNAIVKKRRKRSFIAFLSIVLILLMLMPPSEVYGRNQSSLTINPVIHNVRPIVGNNKFSEVVTDSMSLSGKADTGSQVVVQKIEDGQVSEKAISVNHDGSFSTNVDFIVGPDFYYKVNAGGVKLKVVSTSPANEVEVSLVDNTSFHPAGAKGIKKQTSASSGQPKTFVVYHNSYYFNIGYYIDDNGNAVQSSKDDVAAQLSKFGMVSLSYTESAQNIGLIKAHNPNVKIFAYFNPEFCCISEDPNSEFQKVVVHHPEWLLRDTNGAAIITYNGSEQVMDLTHPGWRGEAVRLCREALTTKGFDGLYLDNGVNDPAWGFDVWQNVNTTSVANWHAALNAFYEAVRIPGKLQFYNGPSPLMDSSMQDYLNRNDGWMDEGYISYKGWMKSAIEMPQFACAQKKFAILYANNPDERVRHFYYMSALLSDGYFFYAPTSTQWFREYGFKLGKPLGQAYRLNNYPGIWGRDFAHAKIIVNPTANDITISAATFNGNFRTLDRKTFSSISIGRFDGEIIVPEYTVTAQLAPQNQRYLQWELTNYGNVDTWVAPYAILYAPAKTSPYYTKGGTITGIYYADGGTVRHALRHAGLGWVHLAPGMTISVFSQACIPSNAKWSVYNAYMYYNKDFHGWLYPKWDQNAQLR